MKKIMRGVLLFGMLGGMLLSCGNGKKEEKAETAQKAQEEGKIYKIGVSQIVPHPALNDAK